jgi:hypothetical protein
VAFLPEIGSRQWLSAHRVVADVQGGNECVAMEAIMAQEAGVALSDVHGAGSPHDRIVRRRTMCAGQD